MKQTMLDAAEAPGVEDGKPISGLTLYVASQWQDLPSEITNEFELQSAKYDELLVFMEPRSVFSPPQKGVFLLKAKNSRGDTRYMGKSIIKEAFDKSGNKALEHKLRILGSALIGIIVFAFIIVFLFRRVASPVEDLRSWTKSLSKDKLQKPVPDFGYSELNSMAEMVKSSLTSVQESLDREKEFLGYASHELRTPIAVTRTNSELLGKLIEKQMHPEKQSEVIERIHRASITMTDLTETLLWLNRDEGKTLPISSLQLGYLVEQLVHDLNYLLDGKKVDVEVTIDTQFFDVPEILCRIILSNLIRNAFQHTSEGRVSIVQTGKCVYITNQNIAGEESEDELGFGLGLQLTQRLIEQYKWDYDSRNIEGGRAITLKLK